MSSRFSRSLPEKPSLAQQRKQARELLEAFNAAEEHASLRIREVLPDKQKIVLADAQFVMAREYGFPTWAALVRHIDATSGDTRTSGQRLHDAFRRSDASAVRTLLEQYPEFRAQINAPVFPYDSPALVAYAADADMVDVLLEFGADPNQRSNWWAGGFHPLHSSRGVAAERLIAAGAVPDACAAANLDRLELLQQLIDEDPSRVHERGGDGQTPLHFARSREVIDLLLDAGADIDARDVDHRATAAEWMLERKQGAGRYALAHYLVQRGASADIFLAAALGLTERVDRMLADNPALLDLRIGRGHYAEHSPSSYHIYMWTIGGHGSPLDVALQFEHPDTVDMMLRHASPIQQLLFACRQGDAQRARAMVKDHPGIVASMTADDHAAITDAAWHGDARAVALMLDLGFDPATPGHDSGTALHCAAWEGSVDTVAAILRHRDARTLVSIRDAHYGGTPLGWCCHGSVHGNPNHDHAGVARLLLNAGAVAREEHGDASPAVKAVLADYSSQAVTR